MESRFDADCNLCCGRSDRRIPTIRAMKYETLRRIELPLECRLRWITGAHACVSRRAGSEAEADREQADNELRNLYALNLREIDGILDRAQDRMNRSCN